MYLKLTSLTCNIIENSISNNGKTHNIDKKQLAVEILSVIFNLTQNEIN